MEMVPVHCTPYVLNVADSDRLGQIFMWTVFGKIKHTLGPVRWRVDPLRVHLVFPDQPIVTRRTWLQ